MRLSLSAALLLAAAPSLCAAAGSAASPPQQQPPQQPPQQPQPRLRLTPQPDGRPPALAAPLLAAETPAALLDLPAAPAPRAGFRSTLKDKLAKRGLPLPEDAPGKGATIRALQRRAFPYFPTYVPHVPNPLPAVRSFASHALARNKAALKATGAFLSSSGRWLVNNPTVAAAVAAGLRVVFADFADYFTESARLTALEASRAAEPDANQRAAAYTKRLAGDRGPLFGSNLRSGSLFSGSRTAERDRFPLFSHGLGPSDPPRNPLSSAAPTPFDSVDELPGFDADFDEFTSGVDDSGEFMETETTRTGFGIMALQSRTRPALPKFDAALKKAAANKNPGKLPVDAFPSRNVADLKKIFNEEPGKPIIPPSPAPPSSAVATSSGDTPKKSGSASVPGSDNFISGSPGGRERRAPIASSRDTAPDAVPVPDAGKQADEEVRAVSLELKKSPGAESKQMSAF